MKRFLFAILAGLAPQFALGANLAIGAFPKGRAAVCAAGAVQGGGTR